MSDPAVPRDSLTATLRVPTTFAVPAAASAESGPTGAGAAAYASARRGSANLIRKELPIGERRVGLGRATTLKIATVVVDTANLCEYQEVSLNFLADRALSIGAIHPIAVYAFALSLMFSLGLPYAWNATLEVGWGPLLYGGTIGAVSYLCLATILAELMVMLPFTGGMSTFNRAAFGPYMGYIVGTCEASEYFMIGAQAIQISGNLFQWFFDSDPMYTPLYWLIPAFIVGSAHVAGARSVMALVQVLCFVSAVGVFVTLLPSLKYIDFWRWGISDIINVPALVNVTLPMTDIKRLLFPVGISTGVFEKLPMTLWTFLGVEATPLLAEEADEFIAKSPKMVLRAVGTMIVMTGFVFLFCPALPPGISKNTAIDPIIQVFVSSYNITSQTSIKVMYATLFLPSVILCTTVFSFACSRQLYSLSKTGYYPSQVSVTWSVTKVPIGASVITLVLMLVVALMIQYETSTDIVQGLLNTTLLYAMVSYTSTGCAYIFLRFRCGQLSRPFDPGFFVGIFCAVFVIVVSVTALASMYLSTVVFRITLYICLGKVGLGLLVFGIYQRRHMVRTPEEVFIQDYLKGGGAGDAAPAVFVDGEALGDAIGLEMGRLTSASKFILKSREIINEVGRSQSLSRVGILRSVDEQLPVYGNESTSLKPTTQDLLSPNRHLSLKFEQHLLRYDEAEGPPRPQPCAHALP